MHCHERDLRPSVYHCISRRSILTRAKGTSGSPEVSDPVETLIGELQGLSRYVL